jgi:hypothetical protein
MSAIDALWAPLVEHGSEWCAPNIHADAQWLTVGDTRWRTALTRRAPRNSYVVSATGQYLDYALEETRRLAAAPRLFSRAILGAIAPMLRALDPIVVLDTLPVSTVLRPARTQATWAGALQSARAAYPGVPILVRSLDHATSAVSIAHLEALGLDLLPSRLVFYQDAAREGFWRHRNLRHDLALVQRHPLQVRPLVNEDVRRIADLYWILYGERHSTLNPRFSPAWLAHGMAAGVLRGEGIVPDGHLAAAYLSYSTGPVMTNPVFGHDTSLPRTVGLYRRLSLMALQRAAREGLVLHASSGAPAFKATRGGVPTVEYHAIDLHGVDGMQGAAWRAAVRIARRIGPALLRGAT